MSVLVIRAHRRFAVRRKARLRKPGARGLEGLLIELSLDGCRISNVDQKKFATGQLVTLLVDGFEALSGHVRWASDGSLGLRFARRLDVAALDRLIRTCRSEVNCEGPLRAYGT